MKKEARSIGKKIGILAICMIVVYFCGFIGSLFTINEVRTQWYKTIRPNLTPPNWVFPVVWNSLFFLIALSFYFALINAKDKKTKIMLVEFFGLNLVYNILWSLLFFGLKDPLFSFAGILVLWLSIVLLILYLRKISKLASWLLFPYLIWVSFAGYLNWLIIA